jgi:hypothetical protein
MIYGETHAISANEIAMRGCYCRDAHNLGERDWDASVMCGKTRAILANEIAMRA